MSNTLNIRSHNGNPNNKQYHKITSDKNSNEGSAAPASACLYCQLIVLDFNKTSTLWVILCCLPEKERFDCVGV